MSLNRIEQIRRLHILNFVKQGAAFSPSDLDKVLEKTPEEKEKEQEEFEKFLSTIEDEKIEEPKKQQVSVTLPAAQTETTYISPEEGGSKYKYTKISPGEHYVTHCEKGHLIQMPWEYEYAIDPETKKRGKIIGIKKKDICPFRECDAKIVDEPIPYTEHIQRGTTKSKKYRSEVKPIAPENLITPKPPKKSKYYSNTQQLMLSENVKKDRYGNIELDAQGDPIPLPKSKWKLFIAKDLAKSYGLKNNFEKFQDLVGMPVEETDKMTLDPEQKAKLEEYRNFISPLFIAVSYKRKVTQEQENIEDAKTIIHGLTQSGIDELKDMYGKEFNDLMELYKLKQTQNLNPKKTREKMLLLKQYKHIYPKFKKHLLFNKIQKLKKQKELEKSRQELKKSKENTIEKLQSLGYEVIDPNTGIARDPDDIITEIQKDIYPGLIDESDLQEDKIDKEFIEELKKINSTRFERIAQLYLQI